MASGDLSTAIKGMDDLIDILKTKEAAVSTAEQAGNLPSLRSEVTSARGAMASYLVTNFGLSSQEAEGISFELSADSIKSVVTKIATSAATLQSK